MVKQTLRTPGAGSGGQGGGEGADPSAIPLDPDRTLALAYVPHRARAALALLWRLDLRMAQAVRAAREPGLGAIRLAWWREALIALDAAAPPDEPLLAMVATTLLPLGIRGAALSAIPEGWGPMLDPAGADAQALELLAQDRGTALFMAAARLLDPGADARLTVPVAAAGAGWALVDVAFGFADPALRERALAMAAHRLAAACAIRWPRALRPLGMLAMLAGADARAGVRAQTPGGPGRALRMARHRLTGR